MRNLEKAAAVEVIVAGWGGGGFAQGRLFGCAEAVTPWPLVGRSGDPTSLELGVLVPQPEAAVAPQRRPSPARGIAQGERYWCQPAAARSSKCNGIKYQSGIAHDPQ